MDAGVVDEVRCCRHRRGAHAGMWYWGAGHLCRVRFFLVCDCGLLGCGMLPLWCRVVDLWWSQPWPAVCSWCVHGILKGRHASGLPSLIEIGDRD